MFKLLIADDEPLERNGLADVVRRLCPSVTEVVVAVNGREAVQVAEELRPEICLLDIKMPGLDGIEVAKRITERISPEAQVIFLTAFDQFDYAREALRLRAREFLVKPASDEEVAEAVEKAAKIVTERRRAEQSAEELTRTVELLTPPAQRQLLESLFLGNEEALRRIAALYTVQAEAALLLGRLTPPAREQIRPVEGREAAQRRRFSRELQRFCRGWGYVTLAADRGGEVRLLLLTPATAPRACAGTGEAQSGAGAGAQSGAGTGAQSGAAAGLRAGSKPTPCLGEEFRSALEERLADFERREGAMPRVLTTEVTGDPGELARWATEGSVALESGRHRGRVAPLTAVTEEADGQREAYELERRILNALRKGREGDLRRFAAQLLEYSESEEELFERLTYFAHTLRVQLPVGTLEGSGASEHERFLLALEELRRRYSAPDQRETSRLVSRAKAHIDNHYMEELSLEQLAGEAGVSPHHLSRRFKQETGETVVGYITRRRLEVARELLSLGDLSVKEVSARCGFSDASYFSRVFAGKEGVSPREYRRPGPRGRTR